MSALIENQRIAKRRKTSTSRSTIKSAGFNTGFMSHFSQKPAHTLHSFKAGYKPKLSKIEKPHRRPAQKRKTSGGGFSFPVPSVATLAVIAGTVLVALTALKWDEFSVKLPETFVFQPATDSETESRTMRYAATGISGILPSFSAPETSALSPAAAADSALSPSAPTETASTPTASALSPEESPEKSEGDLLVTFEWRNYKVKRGDSVSVIAQKYGVSIGAIIASNEISNARRLQEGATLRIPNIDGIPYKIKKGDNLYKISAAFNVPLDVILDVNDIKTDKIRPDETIFIPGARMNDMDLRLSLGELFIYPLQKKYITDNYGMRKDPISGQLAFHTGLDLRADTGTTVMAAMDGTVSVVGENWMYGKHIIMSHANGYKTLYAHLNSFSVKQGDKAARGKKIGESGNTGYSTGPHLHFGVYDKNGKTVNPLDLLN